MSWPQRHKYIESYWYGHVYKIYEVYMDTDLDMKAYKYKLT